MFDKKHLWLQRRRRVSEIIEVGASDDLISRCYDIFSTLVLLINLTVTFLYTFDSMELRCGPTLLFIESLTVVFFAIDYILRLWTVHFVYPNISEGRAIFKYATSFTGLIDLLSFLPYYLPIFWPTGTATFRMFRVVRIFRLFRINAYYDSLNVITEVINSKRQQLMSSVFIIMVLMTASSMCMYSLEHAAQPEVFSNAFSGIWWSVSTLLTVGYGDIYPITTMGKIVGICITFLGVGMVAIPTGIISAGFVDQYSRIKRISEYAAEEDIHFIKVQLRREDSWVDRPIRELGLPQGTVVAAIRRGKDIIVPRGDVILRPYDTLIIGAESLQDNRHIDLKEIVLRKHHPWNGRLIRDLDISRQTVIVMIKRGDTSIIPRGNLILLEGDRIILYSQSFIVNADTIHV